MAMGWMETIRVLGLDLMVATVFAVASLEVAAYALKAAWGCIPRDALSRGAVRPSVKLAGNTTRDATIEVGRQATRAMGST
jgi:hypothetical protein